jgi:DnaJ-class molecular chaperone
MKTFEEKNYYEILKIPYNARTPDIKQAYEDAIEMYDENSLVTYALFPDEQRNALLQVIDEAFHTLANKDKRAVYDHMLISSRQVDAQQFSKKLKNLPAPLHEVDVNSAHRDLKNWVKQKSKESNIRQLTTEILSKSLVSGEDLRQLREALGINIVEIFEQTRISKITLERIEQNRYADLPAEIFLKSFLKSYAKILQIDAQRIVEGYLKHMELSG